MVYKPLEYGRCISEVIGKNNILVESPPTLNSISVGTCWFYVKLVLVSCPI